ncbi:hypothetical protein VP01_410g4 [Puccinia sorghi]|uniref:Uncharacterized protein n=1 Tax=Puccinia sorghi TaxID=27349 RepID=A0A0L6UR79_9BASI|nr:hypothetical protein VP01_410g4 [Puccinia sorghi]
MGIIFFCTRNVKSFEDLGQPYTFQDKALAAIGPGVGQKKTFHADETGENPFEPDGPQYDESLENPFETAPLDDESSENPFESGENPSDSADISDEKAVLDPSNILDHHRDTNDPARNPNQRPISLESSLYATTDGQRNSHRASGRFYSEEHSKFRNEMQDKSTGHESYDNDDDDDDWGDSTTSKKGLKSLSCSSFSIRGILNTGAVTLIALALVIIFGVLPITTFRSSHLRDQQLAGSDSVPASVNDSTDPLLNIMNRRTLKPLAKHMSTMFDELGLGGNRSPRPTVVNPPVSNTVYNIKEMGTPVGKTWKRQSTSHRQRGIVDPKDNGRLQRKMIIVDPR